MLVYLTEVKRGAPVKHVLPAIFLLTLLGGCATGLESGYKPQKIGVTPEERRAYYAPQFSPESQASQQDGENASKARRPVNY